MYPFITVFGRTIGSYGVCMALALLLVSFLAILRARRDGICMEDMLIVAASSIAAALLCAKLLYIIVTYSPKQIWEQVKTGDLEFVTTGGTVFLGGLLGGIAGAVITAKMLKLPAATLERAIVPYLPLGHAIGRVGCVLAGCCYGIAYDGFGAIHYAHAVSGLSYEQGYFPVQLLEAVLNLGVCAYLLCRARKLRRSYDLLFTYLGLYAGLRFFLEFLRGDTVRGIYAGLATSQWVSVAILLACLVHWTRSKRLDAK